MVLAAVEAAAGHRGVDLAGLLESARLEGGEEDLVGGVGVVDRGDGALADAAGDFLGDRFGLDLDVEERAAADELEDFGEEGNALAGVLGIKPAAGVEGAELGEALAIQGAAAVGAAVEGVIVEDDHGPVPAELHVELDHIDAEIEGAPEGGEGVLRGGEGPSAVGDDPRPLQAQEVPDRGGVFIVVSVEWRSHCASRPCLPHRLREGDVTEVRGRAPDAGVSASLGDGTDRRGAQSYEENLVVGTVMEAHRRAGPVGVHVEAAATEDPLAHTFRSSQAIAWTGLDRVVLSCVVVTAPFRDVADHVVQTPSVRRVRADRCDASVPVIEPCVPHEVPPGCSSLGFRAQQIGVSLQLSRIVAHRPRSVLAGAGGILPLGLGREQQVEPLQHLAGFAPRQPHGRQGEGVFLGLARHRRHRPVTAKPLPSCHLVFGQVEGSQCHLVDRAFVRTGARIVVLRPLRVRFGAHQEAPARDQDEDETGLVGDRELPVFIAPRDVSFMRLEVKELLQAGIGIRPQGDESDSRLDPRETVSRVLADAGVDLLPLLTQGADGSLLDGPGEFETPPHLPEGAACAREGPEVLHQAGELVVLPSEEGILEDPGLGGRGGSVASQAFQGLLMHVSAVHQSGAITAPLLEIAHLCETGRQQ